MLFPQLIAGPIVRYADIEQEIDHREYSSEQIRKGIIRFVIGLAKKVIISNIMGEIAEHAFSANAYNNIIISWVGIASYTLQIFFDFAAYSDMAIGLGQMMGFKFLENFNYPYIAVSIRDFWRRWHISLSTWFRDYLYIPLGGNRKGTIRTYFNLGCVFFLTGLWHGASWNFVLWGMFHGFFLIIERMFLGEVLLKIPRLLQHIYTMLVIMIGWVFFKSESLISAFAYFNNMFNINQLDNMNKVWEFLDSRYIICFVIAITFSFPIGAIFRKYCKRYIEVNSQIKYWIENISISILYIISIIFFSGSGFNPFIYFKF